MIRLRALLLLLLLAPTARAQENPADEYPIPVIEEEPDAPQQAQYEFLVNATLETRFNTSVDSGGDFDLVRYEFGFSWQDEVAERTRLGVRLRFKYDSYSFSEVPGFGNVAPWDDIFTLAIGAVVSHDIDEHWTVFGGPLLEISQEDNVA